MGYASKKGYTAPLTRSVFNDCDVTLERGGAVNYRPFVPTQGLAGLVPYRGVNLASFAGIALTDIVPEDQASNGAVYEGPVRANVYVPTTVEVNAGTFQSPTPGIHLFPEWSSAHGFYFTPRGINTGIVLITDLSAETGGTYLKVATNGGADVVLLPGAAQQRGHLCFINPLASDDDFYITITGASAATKVAEDMAHTAPDFPRNVIVTVSATTAAHIKGSTLAVHGLDYYGFTITEDFTITNDTAETLTGNRAFASVSQVDYPAQDGASVTVKVGFGNKLGLPWCVPQKPAHIESRAANVKEGTAPTFTADKIEVSKNTIAYNTVPDGTVRETWCLPF